MKEIKFNDATGIKTRTVKKFAVAFLHRDGLVSYTDVLYETYDAAKRLAEGLESYCKSVGDEEGARLYAESAYCIYPVEDPGPVIDWADVKEESAEETAEKKEVA